MNFNSSADKPRILVTEDDFENQKFLQLILKKEFEVELCDSEETFNEKLSLNHFDVILMDVSLNGGKSGLQIIRELRRKEMYRNIPVVCLSAHVFSQDKMTALEAGVDAYLTKPVDNKLLIHTLHNLARSREVVY
jgi:two-component system phosphate regulon response regulator PhoB